jgi:hypothetical protein
MLELIMLKVNRYFNLIFSAAVLFALNAYFLLNYTPIYGVNDDFLLNEMLSGNYVDEFLTHVTYIQQPVTGLIYLLYLINPQVNFYAYLLLFLVNISLFNVSLANYRINDNEFKLISHIIWAISSFFILSWFILSPTFTAASLLICSSSLLLVYISINKNSAHKHLYIYVIFLWIFGYFLRVKGGVASLIIWMPIIFIEIYIKRNFLIKIIRQEYKIFLKVLSVCAFLFIISNLDINYDKNYSNYLKYNAARQDLTNTTRIVELADLKSNINWTDEQYNIFIESAYADKVNFGYEKLVNAISLTSSSQGISGLINPIVSVSARINNLKEFYSFFACIFILPLVYFTFVSRFNRSSLMKFLLIYACNSFAIYFILATGKFEERVIFPLILNFWMLLFTIKSENRINNYFKLIPVALSLIILLFSFENLTHKPIYYKEKNKWNTRANDFWVKQENTLKSLPNDSVFIGPLSSFRSNWTNPFLGNPDVEFQYLSLGWHTFSPAWDEKRQSLLGGKDSIYVSLISKKNVYWFSDPTTASYFFDYLRSIQLLIDEPKIISSIGDKDNDYGGVYNVYSLYEEN